MRERVSTIIGKTPIILICPHGNDDNNTAIITELAAKQLKCYAVINRGFDRSDSVDVDNDLADCNKIDHVKQDVVYEEYLKPIKKFVQKLLTRNTPAALKSGWGVGYYYTKAEDACHIFHIHGCGNAIHKEAGGQVELVLGYGLGIKKHSLTCDEWRKNLLISLFRHYAHGGEVYLGKGGGKYAGRDSNNMNQYFRKHEHIDAVQSVQLEYPYSTRGTEANAAATAMQLAVVLEDYLKADSYDAEPLELTI
jgi:hypothetical protein